MLTLAAMFPRRIRVRGRSSAAAVGAQADARGASQVLDRGAQTDYRGAAQVFGHGTKSVARGAARCALILMASDYLCRAITYVSLVISSAHLPHIFLLMQQRRITGGNGLGNGLSPQAAV
jgi:hypothetical protein